MMTQDEKHMKEAIKQTPKAYVLEELDNYYTHQDVCIPILGAGLTLFDGGAGATINTVIVCGIEERGNLHDTTKNRNIVRRTSS